MKRIKKIFVLILVILLSGCTVKYKLTINKDLSVNEKVEAEEITNRMNILSGLKGEESINYLYSLYNRYEIDTTLKTKTDGNKTIATVTGDHNSLEDYQASFRSDIVEEVNVTKKDNIVTLIYDQSQVLSSTSTKGLVYDDVEVSIEVPFKVVENNADEIRRNVYTWKIKKDEPVRQMKISFDTSDLKYMKEFKIGNFKFNVRYEILVLGLILIVALTIFIIVTINNRKNNRI